MPKSKSKKSKLKKSKKSHVKNRSSYSIRSLSTHQHNTLKSFLLDINEHSDEIDALKKPDEFWAAEIYGAKTFTVFSSIRGLSNQLSSYRDLQTESPKDALRSIKIIKLHNNQLGEYQRKRKQQTEDRDLRAKLLGKRDRKREKKTKQKEARAKKLTASLRRRLRESERQRKEVEAKLKKVQEKKRRIRKARKPK